MNNIQLQIKTGTSAPGSDALEKGELGFDTTNGKLYIGNVSGNTLINPFEDYVIEEDAISETKSTSAHPAKTVYKKWKSGKIEAWKKTYHNAACTTSFGDLYRCEDFSIAVPATIFGDGTTNYSPNYIQLFIPNISTYLGWIGTHGMEISFSDIGRCLISGNTIIRQSKLSTAVDWEINAYFAYIPEFTSA